MVLLLNTYCTVNVNYSVCIYLSKLFSLVDCRGVKGKIADITTVEKDGGMQVVALTETHVGLREGEQDFL